ncbi:FAD-dependent pyridine nucleotide-disulfide oxidoreductase [Carpediemonas membranifera]|uniref:FAD-dependent pyridine nucleotide-disulfide oxidoreductase n=1 Tax=Carpediemonas membranifera TaxID=201153 RepID=A0A8J6AXX4_9EUKA|nr:FAD-dependent pyridine nucleotide-disulfide oxidoreductase [Carpediemonas membranifera]|eukprot:KAG9391128.1 FAD-dependent pyridine nucleotide-disulfide oxidoreductase [Carpediemonas membranifera]
MVHIDKEYDVIAIGAGAGMVKVVRPAFQLGLKAAIIEKGRFGGTCLNRGCIPSKMYIHPSSVLRHMLPDELEKHFITLKEKPTIDFEALRSYVTTTIDGTSDNAERSIKANPKVDEYQVEAKFVGDHLLQVGDKVIKGKMIIIAVGTVPQIPKLPGLEGTPYYTSNEILRLEKLPKTMITIGGGYIACELTYFLKTVGVDVTQLVRSVFIRAEDEEIQQEFTDVYTKYVNCKVGLTLKRVEHKDGMFTVYYTPTGSEEEVSVTAEALFVATGVTPPTKVLNLESTGVEVDQRGFVKTDEFMRTTAPGIYAIGDVAGKWLFRHAANRDGEYLVEHVVYPMSQGQEPKFDTPIDYHAMPHAIFSFPECAGVGKRESDLVKEGIPFVAGKVKYHNSAMGGEAMRSDHGTVKILVHKETREILGCHMLGEECSIMIHEVIAIINRHGKLEDLLGMIHIHPALSELVRNAGRNARDKLAAEGIELPLNLRWC